MTLTETREPGSTGVRWDLGDLFAAPKDPTWAAAIDECLADASAFADRFRGTIGVPGGPSANHLRAALFDYEAIQDRAVRVQSFARLLYAADSASTEIRGLVARADQFGTELRNRLLFFDLEWLADADADAARLMADPALAP